MNAVEVQTARPDPRRWWILLGAALTVFMAALDMNVLNVALPAMAGQFQVSGAIVWVSLSYTLVTLAFSALAGGLSDRIGRRTIYLTGIIIFLAGSLLCSIASSLPQMIVFRIIQGVGAACVTAPIMAVAATLFAAKERGKAMGIVGTIGPLGAVAGPGLGGLIVEHWGWPAVFLLNVPVGLVCFVLLGALLPKETVRQTSKLDLAGTALLSSGALFMLLGLSLDRWTVILILAGVLLLVLFVLVENRVKSPILPASLLLKSSFSFPLTAIMTSAVIGSALGFISVFFLQGELGMTPSQAGTAILFGPAAMMVASQASGFLTDRIGSRMTAWIGAAIGFVGLALFVPLNTAWSMGDVIVRLFMISFGHGLFATPTNVAMMAAVPRNIAGVGSAVSGLARTFGFALGPALAVLIWKPEDYAAASGLESMRAVLYVMLAVQILSAIAVSRYREEK